MSDDVSEVSGITGGGNTVDLSEIVDVTSQNSGVEAAMSHAMSNALDHATTLPGKSAEAADSLDILTSPQIGEFGREKNNLLSGVERSGAEPAAIQKTDGIEEVSQTLRGLMHELTTWQVTWGIAQTAQKDMSHVLKSS